MSTNDMKGMVAHGTWADGPSWAKVIAKLAAIGIKSPAAPLPLDLISG